MSENERHVMTLIGAHGDVEQWRCPICGREFLMTWPPNFNRTILEFGDENVIHFGGKGDMGMGLDMDEPTIREQEPLPPEFDEWLKGRKK